MLTVDDNYILGYTEMYPAPAARGMVATNYTHTRGIGIGAPKASWEQVAEMDAASAYQGKSLVAAGGPSATVRWAAHLPEAGTMTVHARWSATTDRAAAASYTVQAADGSHVVTVDQRLRGGEWVTLGSYSFAPGQAAIVTLGGLPEPSPPTRSGSSPWPRPARPVTSSSTCKAARRLRPRRAEAGSARSGRR